MIHYGYSYTLQTKKDKSYGVSIGTKLEFRSKNM